MASHIRSKEGHAFAKMPLAVIGAAVFILVGAISGCGGAAANARSDSAIATYSGSATATGADLEVVTSPPSSPSSQSETSSWSEGLFIELAHGGGNGPGVEWWLLADAETGVIYYREYYYRGLTITPLYNSDGSPRIYNGDGI